MGRTLAGLGVLWILAALAGEPVAEGLVLEIQEVETVRKGKNESRRVLLSFETAVQPDSAVRFQAAFRGAGIEAEGRAGKLDGDALELGLKGATMEVLTGKSVPPGLKGPVYNSRPLAFDGKLQVGKPVPAGVLEDGNQVCKITTLITLRKGKAGDLVERLSKQAPPDGE